MLKFLIRRLTRAGEPLLWEMLYHAFYVPAGHEPLPKEIVSEPEIARYVLGWGRATDIGFAAVDDATQKAVGAAWVRLFSKENQGYGWIDDNTPELSVAVLPGFRDRGLGTELLNHLIAESAKDYSMLSLSVSSDNPARRLYTRLGFEIFEQRGSSLTMIKKLERRENQEKR